MPIIGNKLIASWVSAEAKFRFGLSSCYDFSSVVRTSNNLGFLIDLGFLRMQAKIRPKKSKELAKIDQKYTSYHKKIGVKFV